MARIALVAATLLVVTLACHLRWSIASATTWQCDEIPLLVRSTGLCGHVSDEATARDFRPSFYSWYMGALRGLRPPKHIASIHTTTSFWVNLTTHLLGATPAAGRVAPFLFSVAAILIAGWAAWLVVGRFAAVCFAAVIVALSPHAIAYGAQARGYAEAMALAPLLLIALEYLRRKPLSRVRAAVVFAAAVELALTVYTAWLYWALPALVFSVVILPRTAADHDRRGLRATTLIIALGACALMAIFTIDRWTQLTFTAAIGGIDIRSSADAFSFASGTVVHLLPAPAFTLALSAMGGFFLWRSRLNWWLAVMALSVLTPLVFGMLNGSAGYPRNFGYLVVPLALVSAIGGDALLRFASHRFARATVPATAALVVVVGATMTFADSASSARSIIEPDWGAAVLAVDAAPETIGPRWFCRCLANHWQINWYSPPGDVDRLFSAAADDRIEVVLGTQLDEQGREVVFRADPIGRTIAASPLPDHLAVEPIAETIGGVRLRRWRATRFASADDDERMIAHNSTVFVVISATPEMDVSGLMGRILRSDANEEIVTFKPTDTAGRAVHTLVTPARFLPAIRSRMEPLRKRGLELRVYGMEAMCRPADRKGAYSSRF